MAYTYTNAAPVPAGGFPRWAPQALPVTNGTPAIPVTYSLDQPTYIETTLQILPIEPAPNLIKKTHPADPWIRWRRQPGESDTVYATRLADMLKGLGGIIDSEGFEAELSTQGLDIKKTQPAPTPSAPSSHAALHAAIRKTRHDVMAGLPGLERWQMLGE